ncbi:MAG TPA: hypothetical protein VNO20_08760 [Solirubrobacterales bacterium]|nr:hypothetical protein [Solirubrobacterales bacterium]
MRKTVIRQAHTYLVGAVSGTALIAAAVVAFVLLVSTQAFRDWPLAGLPDLNGGGGESSTVSSGKAVAGGTSGTAGPVGTEEGGAASKDVAKATGGNGAGQPAAFAGTPAANGSPAPGSPAESPVAGGPGSGSAPAAGATPSASAPTKSPGPADGDNDGGGGQASGGGGGGSGSTSGQVTGAVKDTVAGVDKVTGGALGDTGATKVTEEVVSGAAGPESTVGKTVDNVADTVGNTVGGLVGGGK